MGDVIRDEFKISILINTDDIDDLNTLVKKWIEILKDTAEKDIKNLEQNNKTENLKTKVNSLRTEYYRDCCKSHEYYRD